MTFKLDERLEQDSVFLGNFPVSTLLMSRDANYPWFILVPRRENITELFELSNEDAVAVLKESRHLSRCLMQVFEGEKLNVAALGNMVPQLHIHHIVRYRRDGAWPGPVWGAQPAAEFLEGEAMLRAEELTSVLGESFEPA